jgi:hypothetical protein
MRLLKHFELKITNDIELNLNECTAYGMVSTLSTAVKYGMQ